jgi:lysophospholipase L1-like esterase
MVEFGGIVAPAGTVTAPTMQPTHTAVVLGDSLNGAEKHGTGNWSLSGDQGNGQKATYTHLSSMWGYVCQSLGYDNVVNSGSGSTGYTDVGDTTYYRSDARIDDDVVEHNPGLVMVGTSFNDVKSDGSNISAVETAANYTINRIKTKLPNAIIVMFGNPKAPVIPAFLVDSIVKPYNTMLKGVAADQKVWFFNPYDGTLYNKDGALVYTDSAGGLMNGNAAYVSSDDTHPTQQGAMVFGKKISEFLRRAHPVS